LRGIRFRHGRSLLERALGATVRGD
jgi:hypothetical protein